MLRAGDRVPHFTVSTFDDRQVRYADLWQRKNLLLVSLPAGDDGGGAKYAAGLSAHLDDLTAYDTACVITRDAVAGVPSPSVLIADRWGEIFFVSDPASSDALPPVPELVDWLRYVQVQCPECQGETR